MKRFESILLVDDDRVFLRLLSRIISAHFDFKSILSAEGGKSGIESYNLNKPDIILIDTNMPEISGIDVCRYIKETKGDLSTIIIGMSANKEYRQEWYGAGANLFFEKQNLIENRDLFNNIYLIQNE